MWVAVLERDAEARACVFPMSDTEMLIMASSAAWVVEEVPTTVISRGAMVALVRSE